ncbi:hypothetical protein D9M68_522010 [compost metagenome]
MKVIIHVETITDSSESNTHELCQFERPIGELMPETRLRPGNELDFLSLVDQGRTLASPPEPSGYVDVVGLINRNCQNPMNVRAIAGSELPMTAMQKRSDS